MIDSTNMEGAPYDTSTSQYNKDEPRYYPQQYDNTSRAIYLLQASIRLDLQVCMYLSFVFDCMSHILITSLRK
jgi:hypothetical protein